LYTVFITDASKLTKKIISKCGIDEINDRADTYYRESQEFYLQKQYREALSYAQKAKSLYGDVDNYVGISKATSLLEEISDAVKEENYYSQNVSLARYYIGEADYPNARIHLGQAKAVVSKLLSSENKSQEIDQLFDVILERERKMADAKSHYDRAYTSLTRSDYETASIEIQKAVSLYNSINHSMGLNHSLILKVEIDEKKGEIDSRRRSQVMSVLVVVLVVFIIIVNYLKKQKDIRRDRDLMRQKMTVEKQEEERQWKIREESKTKERVEEEFKRMIEKERGTLAEGKTQPQTPEQTPLQGKTQAPQIPAPSKPTQTIPPITPTKQPS